MISIRPAKSRAFAVSYALAFVMTADVAAAGIVDGRDVAAGGFAYGDLASRIAERGRSDAYYFVDGCGFEPPFHLFS